MQRIMDIDNPYPTLVAGVGEKLRIVDIVHGAVVPAVAVAPGGGGDVVLGRRASERRIDDLRLEIRDKFWIGGIAHVEHASIAPERRTRRTSCCRTGRTTLI